MASEPVVVFASFEPKKGEEKKVEEILQGMVEPTRAEPGNEIYDLYQCNRNSDGTRTFHLFEKYTDAAALEAHRTSEHYKQYRATIADHLAEPIGVLVLGVVDAA